MRIILSTLLFLNFFFVQIKAQAQATFTTNGNWNNAANWTATNIGDAGEDVTSDNNMSPILVSGDNYTIGNMNAGGDLTVQSGATLTLGTSALFTGGTDKSLTFLNNSTLTVNGTLEIWGDLIVNNALTLNITGSMTVHGDIIMNVGGDVLVSATGTLTVGGNLTGGNNTHLSTSGAGTIAVAGGISLGGGTSSISGPDGSITAGSCSCGGCGGSCPSTVLPVDIIYFEAKVLENSVALKWATSSEVDFNKFIIQRSAGGLEFDDIGEVPGQGRNIYEIITRYSFEDKAPLLGYNYYRLKALDLDNSFEYYGVKTARIKGIKILSAFPNPSQGQAITFATNFNPSEGDRIIILNTFGKELSNFPVLSNYSYYNSPQILVAGVYFLKYIGAEYKETIRFVVK